LHTFHIIFLTKSINIPILYF